jgi:hypothetical protein
MATFFPFPISPILMLVPAKITVQEENQYGASPRGWIFRAFRSEIILPNVSHRKE